MQRPARRIPKCQWSTRDILHSAVANDRNSADPDAVTPTRSATPSLRHQRWTTYWAQARRRRQPAKCHQPLGIPMRRTAPVGNPALILWGAMVALKTVADGRFLRPRTTRGNGVRSADSCSPVDRPPTDPARTGSDMGGGPGCSTSAVAEPEARGCLVDKAAATNLERTWTKRLVSADVRRATMHCVHDGLSWPTCRRDPGSVRAYT